MSEQGGVMTRLGFVTALTKTALVPFGLFRVTLTESGNSLIYQQNTRLYTKNNLYKFQFILFLSLDFAVKYKRMAIPFCPKSAAMCVWAGHSFNLLIKRRVLRCLFEGGTYENEQSARFATCKKHD